MEESTTATPAPARRCCKRWRDDMLSPDNDIHFYVGNQNEYRGTFSVLGTWYPKFENALF